MKRATIALSGTLLGSALFLFLSWGAGFLYWHLRITGSLKDLKNAVRQGKQQEVGLESRLPGAGSRAIPYLLREFRNPEARTDRWLSMALTAELNFALMDAGFDQTWPMMPSMRNRETAAQMEFLQKAREVWWEEHRRFFPPWWMWWSGTRRTE